MSGMLRVLGFCLLALPMAANPAQGSGMAGTVLVGAYQPMNKDAAEVQAARAMIQGQFTQIQILEVVEAYSQVVAGTNFKLVCRTAGNGLAGKWQFVIWHKLDGTWELQSAQRI
jgi:hypothetical protein